MGAGNSTALSCSSMDVRRQPSAAAHYRRHYLNNYDKINHQEQRKSPNKRLVSPKTKPAKMVKLKQANSHFDLSQSHLMAPGWGLHEAPEVGYTLSGANIGPARPIELLPEAQRKRPASKSQKQHVLPPHSQRQQQLSRFSDSLPSLNQPFQMLLSPSPSKCQRHKSAKQTPAYRQPEQQLEAAKVSRLVEQQQQVWPVEGLKRAISLSCLHQQQFQQMNQPASCRRHSRQLNHLREPPQRPLSSGSQQQQSRGQPPLPSKIFKSRAVVSAANQPSRAQKYKQRQQQAQQQAGCPVLPPLPRSQSLHELIQLRATENGQRMRTTGTLRGPFAGEGQASANKVNLVAEILDRKRQEKCQLASSTADRCPSPPAHPQSALIEAKEVSVGRLSENCEKRRPAAGPKSTLKRSASHSALEQQPSIEQQVESSDREQEAELNELARFLYEFKQRQEARNLRPEAAAPTEKLLARGEAPAKSAARQANQQSPNSTSSSSGFASSSCAGTDSSSTMRSSVSSSGGCERRLASRKKYPAPARPDEEERSAAARSAVAGGVGADSASSSAAAAAADATPDNNANKCLLIGKLKLSSSLLSIVDEYTNKQTNRSTIIRGEREGQPGGSGGEQEASLSSEPERRRLALAAGGLGGRHPELEGAFGDGGREVNGGGLTVEKQSWCPVHDNRHDLEQLKRYTQLRQMSQSELALNQLSSEMLGPDRRQAGALNCHQQQASSNRRQAYMSKLISLIRRISDKSELQQASAGKAPSNSHSDKWLAMAAHKGCLPSSVGDSCWPLASSGRRKRNCAEGKARDPSRAINHAEPTYSNESSNQQLAARYDCEGRQLVASIQLPAGACKACCSKQQQQDARVIRSESFCDLNFDCDFELIKNCGSSNNKQLNSTTTTSSSTSGYQASPPLSSSEAFNVGRCRANGYQKQLAGPPEAARKLAAKLPSKRDKQEAGAGSKASDCGGNWRLGLPVGSLAASTNKPPAAAAKRDQIAAKQRQQVAPGKSAKWSASDWLLNNNNNNKNNLNGRSAKASANLALDICQCDCSAARKLVPASGKSAGNCKNGHSCQPNPSCKQSAEVSAGNSDESDDLRRRERAVECEANQLLDELKESLRQVSNPNSRQQQRQLPGGPFSRKAALSWWQQVDCETCRRPPDKNSPEPSFQRHPHESPEKQQQPSGCQKETDLNRAHCPRCQSISRSLNSNENGKLDQDDDEDSDDSDSDYAKINRAMIKATLGADLDESASPSAPSESLEWSRPKGSCQPASSREALCFEPLPAGAPAESQACKAGAVARLMKMRAAKQSVCRSNSELSAANLPRAPTGSGGSVLFGKLRNSLLSGGQQSQANKSKQAPPNQKLAHKNNPNKNHSAKQPQFLLTQHMLNGRPSGSNVDLDDNFILRRKTPNAGLISRC